MGFFKSIRYLFRLCFRFALYAFLLTLPITLFPLWSGLCGGILFTLWSNDRVWSHINSLNFEIESHNSLSYWNVPGAQSIHSFIDESAPFHIPKLKSLDWCQKLAFMKPLEQSDPINSPIDSIGRLDGLVRDISHRQHGSKPMKYWVYVTSFPSFLFNPWDQAFDTVLQELYVKPLPPDTGIFQLDCAASGFLCGIWNVRKPTLVYFEISNTSLAEQDEIDHLQAERHAVENDSDSEPGWNDLLAEMMKPSYTYASSREFLYPVATTIIELPLINHYTDDAASSLLPRTAFPTPLLQLRSIIHNPGVADHFDEHEPLTQTMLRWNERFDFLVERHGSFLYYVNEADKWWSDTVLESYLGLGSKHDDLLANIQNITFMTAAMLSSLAAVPCRWVWGIYAWYMGLAIDGTPLENVVGGNAQEEPERNMWDDMMDGFWDHLAKNLSAQISESAGKAAVTDTVQE